MRLGRLELGQTYVVGYVLEYDFEGHADDKVFGRGVFYDDVGRHDGALVKLYHRGYKGHIADKPGMRRALDDGVGVESSVSTRLHPLGVAGEAAGRYVSGVEVGVAAAVAASEPEFVFFCLLPVHIGFDLRCRQRLVCMLASFAFSY